MSDALDMEIEKNYRVFRQRLGDLLETHRGKYALLRHEEIVGIYDTVRDSQMTGSRFYGDGLFSVQKIEGEPTDIGFFSHALHMASSQ